MKVSVLFAIVMSTVLAFADDSAQLVNLATNGVNGTAAFGGSSTHHTGKTAASYLFDGNIATYVGRNASGEIWYQFSFNYPVVVNAVGIGVNSTYYAYAERSPKTFTIDGWDVNAGNGGEWVVLGEFINISDWSSYANKMRLFNFENTEAYTKYRLYEKRSGYTGIAELAFYYIEPPKWESPVDLPDLHVSLTGSDENTGTSWEEPKKTIAAAIEASETVRVANGVQSASQKIIVDDGEYSITAPIVFTNFWIHFTLESRNGRDSTIIRGNGTSALVTANIETLIRNLTFCNGAVSPNGVVMSMGSGANGSIKLNSASIIENCIISNCVSKGQIGAALALAHKNSLVTNCLIVGNCATNLSHTVKPQSLRGAAVAIDSGTVIDCEIRDNVGGSGVAAYLYGGTIERCLIHNNRREEICCGSSSGIRAGALGTVAVINGIVRDCIITNNITAIGSVYIAGSGTVTGSEIAYNKSMLQKPTDCDVVGYNYMFSSRTRLLPFAGVVMNSAAGKVVNCNIHDNASPTYGEGQGAYIASGTISATTFSNNGGQGGTAGRADIINVSGTVADDVVIEKRAESTLPTTTYAVPDDGLEGVYPYDTPEKAARSIQAAIDAVYCPDGSRGKVIVAPGVYKCKNGWNLKLAKPVEVVGPADYSAIVHGQDADYRYGAVIGHSEAILRNITLTHFSSKVEGIWASSSEPNVMALLVNNGLADNLIITGCYKDVNVAASFIMNGKISNSLIANNFTRGKGEYDYGGGVRMWGGVLEDCIIENNKAVHGGGVSVESSSVVVRRCRISGNSAYGYTETPAGGGLYISAGRIENCLIDRNASVNTVNAKSYGSGVYMEGGTLVNSTIVSNRSVQMNHYAGVHKTSSGSIVNCIVWANHNNEATQKDISSSSGVSYSCYGEAEADNASGNFSDNPKIELRPVRRQYRLLRNSPCIDAGKDIWTDADTDLAGEKRIRRRGVDLGAYEMELMPGFGVIIR